MACIFDNCELHTKAESKKRNVMCSCISNSFDFSVNTAIAKASGYKDAVCIGKKFISVLSCHIFGIDPVNIDSSMACDSAMLQRLNNTDIGIMQGDIFSDKCDIDLTGRCTQSFHHSFPVIKIRFRTRKIQTFAGYLGQMFTFHCKRRFIKIFHIEILKHITAWYIAEKGNFIFDCFIKRMLGAANNNIRPDSHTLKLFYTGLGRFCFHFSGCLQIRNQGDVN